MKTLSLVLKRKWFDMIASGEKTEEYREIKPHWMQRLCELRSVGGRRPAMMTSHLAIFYSKNTHLFKFHIETYEVVFKNFDAITFYLGYAKARPSMTFTIKEIAISPGRTEWGAEKGKMYFVIKLGKRL